MQDIPKKLLILHEVIRIANKNLCIFHLVFFEHMLAAFSWQTTVFLARIFQHEIDHTNGIVFIDHIKDEPKAFFKLDDAGKLQPLDYEKDVKHSATLWSD